MVGNSSEAFRRYEVSALTARTEVHIARRWDAPCVSLGRGQQPIKQRWGREIGNMEIALGRSPLLWRFYVTKRRGHRAYRSLRLRVREYLRSDTTPEWVRDVAKMLKRRDDAQDTP